MTQTFVDGQTLDAADINLELAFPTGALIPYAGVTAPTQTSSADPRPWLLCDGNSYSTTTYAALFAIIQYTFGGSGSSFKVPDLRGRVPMGQGTGAGLGISGSGQVTGGSSLAARTVGQWGGDERMPQHSHGVTDPGHFHTTAAPYHLAGGSGGNNFRITDGSSAFVGNVDANSNSKTTGITVNQEGAGQGGNMPPFLVVSYLIKT